MIGYTLCGDISGTHTRLFLINNSTYKIVLTYQYDTKSIEDISTCINEILKGYENLVLYCVLACAGPIKDNKVELANANLIISGDDILTKTYVEKVYIINDFEAMAYGVKKVSPNKQYNIKNSKTGTELIIGAGTGLGVGVFQKDKNSYFENKEAGHKYINWDCLAYSENIDVEQLKQFSQQYYKKENIEWEELLSGKGIEMLHYLITGKKENADKIGNTTRRDVKETFDLFYYLYSQAINFFSIEFNCSQVFVVGGIVEKTCEFITKNNFINHITPQLGVTVILDYDVSLYGLVEYVKELLQRV